MRQWSKGRRSQKHPVTVGVARWVGAVTVVRIDGVDFPAHDATAHTITSYPLPAEMTATGEIVDGKPHIHAVMTRPRQAQMKSEPPSTFTVAPVTYPFRRDAR
jgi:hypothetical protein